MTIPRYRPAEALEFFKPGGKVEHLAPGKTIFTENKRGRRLLLERDRMYLVLKGEVSLVAGAKDVGAVKVGEIFGEMAAIANVPRSATAVAKTPCRIIGLDDRQFRKALKRKPGFALMLMGVMVARLRETVARLKAADALPDDAAVEASAVLDPKLLADMVRGLSEDPPVSFLRNQVVLQEGQVGTRMYAVLEGHVTVSIGGKVVDRVGPGGVLGEIALLDQSPRVASAVAEDHATLQPINRNVFVALVQLQPELGVALLTALSRRLRYLTGLLK